jgi:zinc transport system substrate-binding protein
MRTLLIFATAVPGLLSMSCAAKPSRTPALAVSILPQRDFVQQVLGGQPYRIMVMIPPGASPETYSLSPEQMGDLGQATAYFALGSGLPFEEVWLGKIEKLNPGMKVFDCSEGIERMSGAAEGEREQGVHGEDPHVWLSPENAVVMVNNIAQGMGRIDPGHRDLYLEHAAAYCAKLKDLDADIARKFASIPRRTFIVFHPAWGYFARRYGLDQVPIEVEGKEPKAAQLQGLIQEAGRENIRTVFASPEFNAEGAQVIAREIGGRVVTIDPLADDYIANMLAVSDKLAEAMKR